jgi:hypothetical protein
MTKLQCGDKRRIAKKPIFLTKSAESNLDKGKLEIVGNVTRMTWASMCYWTHTKVLYAYDAKVT